MKWWNRFFFSPIDPRPLAIFRIAFGAVALLCLIGRFHDRLFLYGHAGLISRATIDSFFSAGTLGRYVYLYGFVPGHDPALMGLFIVLMVAAFCVAIGLFTRVNTILLFIGLTALSNRNFFIENSGDDLLRIFSFLLMFAPAGAAYSIDKWRRVRISGQTLTRVSAWPLRLLQLQIAYVYLDTVFLKLHGPAWRDGTALYYALNYLEFKRFDVTWLFHYLWQIRLATWSVLAVETAMFTLVWSKRWRHPVLLAALVMHLGINFAMQFSIFQYVMIAGLTTFI